MKLVLIHGRSQGGKNPAVLRQTWMDALQRGLQKINRRLPLEVQVVFPFYGDVLDSMTPDGHLLPGLRLKGEESPPSLEEQKIIIEILTEIAAARGSFPDDAISPSGLQEKGVLNWHSVHALAKLLDQSGAGGLVLEQFTRDVAVYLTRPVVRRAVNNLVHEAVVCERSVVVAHSLGTVVAFDVLRSVSEGDVASLITLGSPLGIKAIRKLLEPPRLAMPLRVKKWVNGRDPSDVVALYPLDETHFPIEPVILNYSDIRNRELGHRHSIDDYLRDAWVAEQIFAALTT